MPTPIELDTYRTYQRNVYLRDAVQNLLQSSEDLEPNLDPFTRASRITMALAGLTNETKKLHRDHPYVRLVQEMLVLNGVLKEIPE